MQEWRLINSILDVSCFNQLNLILWPQFMPIETALGTSHELCKQFYYMKWFKDNEITLKVTKHQIIRFISPYSYIMQ